jgi:hypothetical protein
MVFHGLGRRTTRKFGLEMSVLENERKTEREAKETCVGSREPDWGSTFVETGEE